MGHGCLVSAIWRLNSEEERLLGVSITGMCDHYELAQPGAESMLEIAKKQVNKTNAHFANVLGINVSAATTCVKPSGNVSQLVDSSSGMSERFSDYYIRTVRADIKDPLTEFMIAKGFPVEPAIGKEDTTVIFSFPIKSPAGAVMRDSRTALEQLEYWQRLQDHWCEHKPSVTIFIKEHEWFQVADWVYQNFDKISGVSFLPFDNGTYQQAPYTAVSEEFYNEFLKKMPEGIDFSELVEYTDNVEGVQTLACSGGSCEI